MTSWVLGRAGETMISGISGEEFAADIFIGPVYYQRLRHMVADKFQVLPTCLVQLLSESRHMRHQQTHQNACLQA